MAEFIINQQLNKKSWEDFLLAKTESSFLQSWHWGEFNEALGKKVFRLGFEKNNKIVGLCLIVVEKAKRGKHLIVPGGPILDWNNPRLVDFFFSQIKQLAKQEKCVFVRLRPQLPQEEKSLALFRKQHAINSPVHLHAELTSQLNLTPGIDLLLSQMRKTTRYEIRKAEKLGIEVRQNTNPDRIKTFYEIELETARRQKFIPFSYQYLYEQFCVFSKNNLAVLFESFYENKLLSQAFVIFYNQEAIYHYGTSTEEGRKYPGAYLSQWEIIKEAKKRGLKKYNFWGVAPVDQPRHRFYKISVFKRGFGGQDFAYLHAQDLIIDKKKYFFNFLIENLRKKIRRI